MPSHNVEELSGQIEKGSQSPDFAGLVRFLVEPFLEEPSSLKIDCEPSVNRSRVWIRLAFKEEERGRVFGRGGRNIQAIRKVLDATAQMVGWSAYLDIYGEAAAGNGGHSRGRSRSREHSRPVHRSRPQQSDRGSS